MVLKGPISGCVFTIFLIKLAKRGRSRLSRHRPVNGHKMTSCDVGQRILESVEAKMKAYIIARSAMYVGSG